MKNIFLVDGLGALLSALMLGIVLPSFKNEIGMPTAVLVVLSLVALVLGGYSVTCFFFAKASKRNLLKLIMVANLVYCLTTAFLVTKYLSALTKLGVAYFIGEILIILILVWVEFITLRKEPV